LEGSYPRIVTSWERLSSEQSGEKPNGSRMPGKVQDAEEVEWIQRAQRGDHEAFAYLVERHQRRVFSLVFRMVRHPAEVEDLAQEIFIKVFRSIRGYHFEASFGAWVTRIAVNHCYDYLRHLRSSRVTYDWQLPEEAHRLLETAPEPGEKGALTIEDRTVLKDLTQKLLERAPAEDRLVLVLKEMESLSIEDIATALHWTPSKVKVRLHRARKRMLADFRRWRQGGKP
jgi:RNA polymerase sigma-70 factor, ECF subfamily